MKKLTKLFSTKPEKSKLSPRDRSTTRSNKDAYEEVKIGYIDDSVAELKIEVYDHNDSQIANFMDASESFDDPSQSRWHRHSRTPKGLEISTDELHMIRPPVNSMVSP